MAPAIKMNATAEEIQVEIENELARSKTIHQEGFKTELQAFGVITEEYYEVVEAFRTSKDKYPENNGKLRRELVQLAAMCMKTVESGTEKEEVFEKMKDYMAKNCNAYEYDCTMEALGGIRVDYFNLTFCVCGEVIDSLWDQLTFLATSCKIAIMSCCVEKEVAA